MKKRLRKIDGLIRVRAFRGTPPFAGKSRLRGRAALGIAYERKVGRWLHEQYRTTPCDVICSKWFQFSDAKGSSFAQPDALALFEDRVVIFEVKLKQNTHAIEQITHLYGPLMERYYERPWCGVQVYKFPANVDVGPPPLCDIKAIDSCPDFGVYNMHIML